MSFTAFFSLFLVLIAQLRLVSSSPIQANAQAVVLSREELEVWSPSIIYPKGGEVWQVGQTVYNMTWETDNIPYQARNNTGVIMLGYLDGNDTENEHLYWQKPVASGFPITDGFVRFTISPDRNLTTMHSYILCLLGDSGNISPTFTIDASQA